VEIIGAQLTTLRRQSAIQPYPGLTGVLTDPRIDHVIGDGRAFVLRSGPVFDIIEMDALRPTSAYAGNLYSREYFDLLRRRLKPGGFAVTWAPTARTRDTFASVFPHALVFGDIMVGEQRSDRVRPGRHQDAPRGRPRLLCRGRHRHRGPVRPVPGRAAVPDWAGRCAKDRRPEHGRISAGRILIAGLTAPPTAASL
jgi:hypothetical protein